MLYGNLMSAQAPNVSLHFATQIYRAALAPAASPLVQELDGACRSLAEDDDAGLDWCEANGYPGYTSYASLDDLPWRFPVFGQLVEQLDRHVASFAGTLDFDLKGGKLECDSLWVNVLPTGGMHSSHLHPHSVISGTFYVALPEGSAAIRFEDPRLAFMMAAPTRRNPANRPFVKVTPEPGEVLLWESWLRHEVPMNEADDERISISFNYAWK